jgi:hypothetical protein
MAIGKGRGRPQCGSLCFLEGEGLSFVSAIFSIEGDGGELHLCHVLKYMGG